MEAEAGGQGQGDRRGKAELGRFFGPQNLKYLAQGRSRDIAPLAVSDNGRLTAFRYPAIWGFPSVFVVQDAKNGVPDVCTTGQVDRQRGA